MIDIITHPVFLWIVGFLAFSGLFMWGLTYFVASKLIYTKTLGNIGRKDGKWGRGIPDDIPDDSREMYDIGIAWANAHADKKRDVHIKRGDIDLYGEYYDLGGERCAVILSGRSECLIYGYYFAIPYANSGCNILVVDPRAHGLSGGEFNTVGFEESLDDIEWLKFMRDEFGVKSFILHGICIGAAGGMFAITNPDCPAEVEAIVTEGMFPNFAESMKNNLKERKKPVLGLLGLINMWMKHYTGHSMKYGPINVIDKLDRPLLMLQGKKDRASLPENGAKLFELAGTKEKRIVYFDEGRHSMLRYTDTEKYDTAISEFIKTLDERKAKI